MDQVKKFVLVRFKDGAAVVPKVWVVSLVDCWWPENEKESLERMVRTEKERNEDEWKLHQMHILGSYGEFTTCRLSFRMMCYLLDTYDKARSKLPKSVDTSAVDTTEDEDGGGKRPVRKYAFFLLCYFDEFHFRP